MKFLASLGWSKSRRGIALGTEVAVKGVPFLFLRQDELGISMDIGDCYSNNLAKRLVLGCACENNS